MDQLKIQVKGGRGGAGQQSFGGVGGNGGDVYLVAKKSGCLVKLNKSNPSGIFSAQAGLDSKRVVKQSQNSWNLTDNS